MILRKSIWAAFAFAASGARPIIAANQTERHLYSTDICVSVIAIAGFPDYRYLEDNDIDIDIFDEGEEFVCELSSGLTVPIRGSDEQMEEMRVLLNEGKLISYEMTVGVADNMISVYGDDDSVYLPPGKVVLAPRIDRRKKQRALKGGGGSDVSDRYMRKLKQETYEGDKPVLAVRVIDSEGKAHSDNADVISDKIFGTDDDVANLKSQFAACSYGKLRVTNQYTVDISKHLSAPGVIEITIDKALMGNDRTAIRTAMINAAQTKLGFQLPGPFESVMFVIEQCYTDCGWAAYAYVNSWFSAYQGDNYKYVGVQMHEIGHNLNLAHSGGLDGKTYTDHTCVMGNPYYSDNVGMMCFNPAKNFQIAKAGDSWYNDNNHDIAVWNSGLVGGAQWSGTIIGIADYKSNPDFRPVVVKVESGSTKDLFLGFNRAIGVNKDTADAQDRVTVIEAGNDGLSYAQSFLKASLSQGETYTIANWRQSGFDLTIHVKEINLDANPGYADVIMTHEGITENPTPKPTPRPTFHPTIYPTPNPTQMPTRNSIEGICGNSVCETAEDSRNCPIDCLGRELKTTFEFNLGSGGNMFTVEAKRSMIISSLAINSSSRGEGRVKIYTRKGGYDGHVESSDGWELIYDNPAVTHARRGHVTELGDIQQVIEAGDSRSFFITSTRGLVYKSGSLESAEFVSDESLSILEGIGTDASFSSTKFTPRVWGGIIRYNVIGNNPTMAPTKSTSAETCGDNVCSMEEGAETCPTDCAGKELQTTFDFSLGSSGNMFSVEALRDITVSSLIINAMSRGEGTVKVYTRNGSYSGYERSSEGWELIYDNPTVAHNRRGKLTELGDFYNAVSIAGGATQSFFVTSSRGLVYQSGSQESAEFVSDESMSILVGVGTTDEFAGTIHSPRVFGGIVRYNAHRVIPDICGDSMCGKSEDFDSCPIDCARRELQTTFEFSLGSSGNMFTVEAQRDIAVSSFAINAMSRGEGEVKVYTRNGSYNGHVQSSEGWELIYHNHIVVHNRRGRRTELGDFANAVIIKSGATQSFFVTSSKGLVYKEGTKESAEFVRDESLVIHEGLGTTGEFSGDPFSPRVFGGIIRYDVH